jgi:uncharacterized protein
MTTPEIVGAMVVGVVAGVSSGLLGVGGGILFVPALVILLHESQLRAQSTSLLAVVIVAFVGAWRQRAYGNVRVRDGVVLGALSPLGVVAGASLANALPARVLEISFAVVQLYFAWRLARRALRREPRTEPAGR